MNKNTNTGTLALVAITFLVAVAGFWTALAYNPSKTVTNNIPAGSVSNPDIQSPNFSYGGVRHWGYHMTWNTSTSTGCSFQSPPATTTIAALVVNLTNSTGTTFPIDAGWSAITNAATSATPILSYLMPASASLTLVATSSGMEQAFGGIAIEKKVLQPNTWINVKSGTSSNPGTSGFCNMTLLDATQ